MPTMRPQWAFYSLFLGWAAGRAAARCHHSGMSESSALADLRVKMINKNIALAICGAALIGRGVTPVLAIPFFRVWR